MRKLDKNDRNILILIGLIVYGVFAYFWDRHVWEVNGWKEPSAAGDAAATAVAQPPPVKASVAYTLHADDLSRAYKDNEVAADLKYKGKLIVVFGRIERIGKDLMGNAYIVIGGSGFLDGVQCTFPKNQEGAVAQLSTGQELSAEGEVLGKMGNVLVGKARLPYR